MSNLSKNHSKAFVILVALFIAAFLWHLFSGVFAEEFTETQQFIFWELRLPRAVIAASVGAGLAIAGAALQALFRNPLAEPGLIGVAATSALGVVLALSASVWLGVQFALNTLYLAAFLAALLGLVFIFWLSTRHSRTDVALMLLAGVALNALAAALIQFILSMSPAQQMQNLLFWMYGSLANHGWSEALFLAAVSMLIFIGLWKMSHSMNAYQLGASQAYHLGRSPQKLVLGVILATALMVAASVSVVGVIGFVGLVVPHLIRMWIGGDYRVLLPLSALAGASLLLVADKVAQLLIAPSELPIGILMALLGGPFFMWMILRHRREITL